MTPKRHIGGSILASNSPAILRPIVHTKGVLQVQALPDEDTHCLTLFRFNGQTEELARHPNGFSCHILAERIVKAWDKPDTSDRAIEQLEYIIRCAGTGEVTRLKELLK